MQARIAFDTCGWCNAAVGVMGLARWPVGTGTRGSVMSCQALWCQSYDCICQKGMNRARLTEGWSTVSASPSSLYRFHNSGSKTRETQDFRCVRGLGSGRLAGSRRAAGDGSRAVHITNWSKTQGAARGFSCPRPLCDKVCPGFAFRPRGAHTRRKLSVRNRRIQTQRIR